jgi:hypothetical protein
MYGKPSSSTHLSKHLLPRGHSSLGTIVTCARSQDLGVVEVSESRYNIVIWYQEVEDGTPENFLPTLMD